MARGREGAAGRTGCGRSAFWGMSKLQTGDAVCPEQGLAQDQPRAMGWELLGEGFGESQIWRVLYWGEGLADLRAPALC